MMKSIAYNIGTNKHVSYLQQSCIGHLVLVDVDNDVYLSLSAELL